MAQYRAEVRDKKNRTWRKPGHMGQFWNEWENARADIEGRAKKAANIGFACEFRVVRIDDEQVMYGPVLSTTSGAQPVEKEAEITYTYVLQHKLASADSWRWFDSNISKEYTLEQARKRARKCSFGSQRTSMIRITRQQPLGVVYEGKPTQDEFEAWLDAFSDHHTEKETTSMDYEPRKALHIPRETLIEKVQASIDEKKVNFELAEQKQLDANAELIERVRALVEGAPGNVTEALRHFLGGYDESALSDKIDHVTAIERIKSSYPAPGTAEFQPDPVATKLVSVLSAATDESIEVTPSDDFYAYL